MISCLCSSHRLDVNKCKAACFNKVIIRTVHQTKWLSTTPEILHWLATSKRITSSRAWHNLWRMSLSSKSNLKAATFASTHKRIYTICKAMTMPRLRHKTSCWVMRVAIVREMSFNQTESQHHSNPIVKIANLSILRTLNQMLWCHKLAVL